jgi:lipid-A-disaccharide synthase
MGVPVLYYISPQLWASREWRIAKVRRCVDRVACILPFEEAYYRNRGVNATFVGHPLFDELPKNRKLSPEPREFTAAAPPVIGVMPGSRRAEIRGNLPRLFEVMDRIAAAYPGTKFEIATTPPTDDLVRHMAQGRANVRIEQGAIDAMAPGWDFCLAKSGTTTLHVAAYGVPMIVVFYASKFLWHAIGKWLLKIRSVALVNILARRSPSDRANSLIVPEFFPWNGPTAPVADAAIEFLRDVRRRREQRQNLLAVVATLDRPGASARAARIAMEMAKPLKKEDAKT